MVTRAYIKNFLREIRETKSRFISLFCMSMLSVAFYVGLQATSPDMQITADNYYKQTNFMDIQLVSTIGFNDDDVNTIRSVTGISELQCGYSADVYVYREEQGAVFKVISLQESNTGRTINQYELLDGRAPQSSNECLMEQSYMNHAGYSIGDSIELKTNAESDISDTFNITKFTIVGAVKTSVYISGEFGRSSLGDGKIDSYIYVPQDTFSYDVYTDLFLKVEGSDELKSFSDKYDELILPVKNALEQTGLVRTEIRYNEILNEGNTELADARKKLEDGRIERDEKVADAQKEIDDAYAEIADGEKKLADEELSFNKKISDGEKQIRNAKNQIAANEKTLTDGEKKLSAARKELEDGKKILKENKKQLDLAKSELDQLNGIINALKAQADLMPDGTEKQDLLNQIAILNNQYSSATSEYNSGLAQYNVAKEAMDAADAELSFRENELAQGKQKLADGKKTLASQSKKLADGKAEGEKKIADAQAELSDARKKLNDAEKELNDTVRETDQELEDAQKEIDDAQKKLDDLSDPKWYVWDRNDNAGYSSYALDTERIGNIGNVFPVVFFIVAVMVSLTTMIRMVEERRTQIGIFKALGYSQSTVTWKYLTYALSASILGCVVGLLVGHTVFPIMIFTAYGFMYDLPSLETPIDWMHSLAASVAAIGSMTLATYLACRQELKLPSAELLRPKPPAMGKRIFLERIRFLWIRMKFTHKVTARNLFRYKLRFFMTVLGIAGCMALLITGFGIRDAITEIGPKQFEELFLYKMMIHYDEASPDNDYDKLTAAIQNEPRITEYTQCMYTTMDAKSNNETASVTVLTASQPEELKSFINLRIRQDKKPVILSGNGAVLTEKAASILNVSPGDTIILADEDDNREYEIRVDGICENYVGHYVFLTSDYYRSVFNKDVPYNTLLAGFNNDVSESDETDISGALMQLDTVTGVTLIADIHKVIKDLVRAMDVVVSVLVGAAGMLAFIVLFNLNHINISERMQELATILVLGFTDREVTMYVYRENVILTILGILLGCVLGPVMHQYIILTVEVNNMMFVRSISPLSYLWSVLLAFAFAVIVNLFTIRYLKKIDMVEALKSGE